MKFSITFDVLYRKCEIEVEAETKDEALDKLHEMDNEEFNRILQNTDDCTIKNEHVEKLK